MTENNGWQPIETAPRDGAFVLLLINRLVVYGCWREEIPEARFDKTGWYGCFRGRVHDCCLDEPTHWRPLPEPPEQQP